MENFKILDLKLNSFLNSFHCQEQVHIQSLNIYGLALLQCGKLFQGRFLRSLIIAKKKIVQAIQCFISRTSIDYEKIKQHKYMSLLGNQLKYLTMQPSVLLKQGSITMYLALADITKREQQRSQKDENSQFLLTLKSIIKALNPLIYFNFVYKQYIKRKNSISSYLVRSHSKISSQKKITCEQGQKSKKKSSQKQQNLFDEQTITQIEQQFSELSVSELIQKYLKEEENKIIDSTEICRICSSEIKLKNFEKHIKHCSRRAKLQSQLKELEQKGKLLNQQISTLEKALMLKEDQLTEKEIYLIKLFKSIRVNNSQNSRKNNSVRRNTQLSYTTKKQPIEQIKLHLQLFEENFGKDELLSSFVQNKQQTIIIKKKLTMVDINENSDIRSSKGSQIGSFKSLQFSINNAFTTTNGFKTKKSLFASKKSSQIKLSNSDVKSSSHSSSNSSFSIKTSSSKRIDQGSYKQKQKVKNKSQSIKEGILKKDIEKVKLLQSRRATNKSDAIQLGQGTKKQKFKSLKHLTTFQENNQEQMTLNDFEILKFLGKGAFGKVYLVRRKATKDLYALKHIMLDHKENSTQMQLIKKQHEIFKKIAGDHLIRAPFAFSQNYGHFFILQFMPGGDLSKILTQQVYLQEENAKFYLAQIILSLQHLHQCEIIHRDLKPQNIVIDKNGHIKLTDFGLSDIKIQDKLSKAKQKPAASIHSSRRSANSGNRRVALVNRRDIAKIIGTPDYIAPEIINQTSINNNSIDWWSLGVIAYEMLVGCRPFSAMTLDQVLKNIVDGKIQWPEIGRQQGMMSPEAYDLIFKLLDKNFKRRLGSQNCEQIKNHPFFKEIDWKNIKKQQAPIIPKNIMQKLKQYSELKQDEQLRLQITNCNQNFDSKIKKSIGLQNFVRYDFLLEQTCQSVEQRIKKQKVKIQRIKTIGSFIQGQQKENNSQNAKNGTTTLKRHRISGGNKNVSFQKSIFQNPV